MAYAWRIGPSNIGFNLDESEEALLLAGYVVAKDVLGLDEPWLAEFEEVFLESGKGVGERMLRRLNEALRRAGKGHLALTPAPSGKTPYMNMRGVQKTMARRRILEDLRGFRAGMLLAEARDGLGLLPELPDHEADEQLAMFAEAAARSMGGQAAADPRTGLSEAETQARAAALARARRGTPADDGPVASTDTSDPPGGRIPAGRATPAGCLTRTRPPAPPGTGEQPDVGDDALLYMWSDKLSEQPPAPSEAVPSDPSGGTIIDVLLRIEAKLGMLARMERKLDAVLRIERRLDEMLEAGGGQDGRGRDRRQVAE